MIRDDFISLCDTRLQVNCTPFNAILPEIVPESQVSASAWIQVLGCVSCAGVWQGMGMWSQ